MSVRTVVPCVDGVLSSRQVAQTAQAIARTQEPCGSIPWTPGEHADVWNHVEAAMALLVGGEVEAAERAYAWVPTLQNADGSWPMKVVAGQVLDPRSEVNMSAYLAVGIWHHWLIRRDRDFVDEFWPVVRTGLDWVVSQQLIFGGINWTPTEDFALLAGSSSIHQSLQAGVALAELLGDPQPEWELAGGRLAHAIREHPHCFADKSTYSMDWYYPVLGGAVRGERARRMLASRWDDFVVDGLGVRCVDTNPWVTGAETCELAMALDAVGDHARAVRLLADMQHLRADTGEYWTGWVFGDEPGQNQFWPVEHTSYTAAAVILAVDALGCVAGKATAGAGIMRGDSFGAPFLEFGLQCSCSSGQPIPSLANGPS